MGGTFVPGQLANLPCPSTSHSPESEAQAPAPACLQVFDKWQDDSDSLAAAGSLPLQQVSEHICDTVGIQEDGGMRGTVATS